MFLWGMPFLAAGGFVLSSLQISGVDGWLTLVIAILFGGGGGALTYIAVFGSKKSISKAANYMQEGGDGIGAIFALSVFLVAFPIALLIRAVRTASNEESEQ
jgi:hypothetical protein